MARMHLPITGELTHLRTEEQIPAATATPRAHAAGPPPRRRLATLMLITDRAMTICVRFASVGAATINVPAAADRPASGVPAGHSSGGRGIRTHEDTRAP